MADERTPEEEIREDQNQEESESSASVGKVSRRQFLVGAGTGLVVGAAGAAGVLSLVKPATVAQPAPVQPAPAQQSATANDLPPRCGA